MNLEAVEPKLLYLACPFTHSSPEIQEYRYRTSCRVAAKLMRHGINVFNPLSHSVPICEFLGEIEDQHKFWMSVDLPILRRCDEILILGMENWTESRGVKAEMFEALSMQIPITQIDESDLELLPNVKKTSRRFLKSALLPVVDDVS